MKVVEVSFLALRRILLKYQTWTLVISRNLRWFSESKHLDLVVAKYEEKLPYAHPE